MPAIERQFSAPAPSSLYVDADVLVNYLVRSQPHHARAPSFLRRLAELGSTTLYVSSLTWLEVAHVITRENFRGRLPADVRQQFRLDQW